MARDRAFGYLQPPPDGRNFKFLAAVHREEIAQVMQPKPRKRQYKEGPILDQGSKPHCVGFSGKGFLNAAPIMSKPAEDPTPQQIYFAAQDRDEWPGNNYDGSSVRGGCEALKAYGLIESYVWFTNVNGLIDWTNNGFGTAWVGTNFYATMDDVDGAGYIQMPGSLATPIGGHAYRLNWFDKSKDAFLFVNSWGNSWGILKRDGTRTGTAYLRRVDAERLLFKEDGEAAGPTQVKLKARALGVTRV